MDFSILLNFIVFFLNFIIFGGIIVILVWIKIFTSEMLKIDLSNEIEINREEWLKMKRYFT